MDRLLWKLLMWIWTRRARKVYGGPGDKGEWFNTASFQQVAGKTTGQTVGDACRVWLVDYGFDPGTGGCHWHPRR